MDENKTKSEDNKKPLNIVLLGEDCSEKEKLISKFLLTNSQYQESENNKEDDKKDDKSVLQNIIHIVEMHGDKVKMKLWDNPSEEEFLSPSIKIAQGILLFYSVKNRNSFEKIKKDLSKIIELGRFDIPIVIIGNHSNASNREVSYDEAKTYADNYGLRFYETSIESDISIKEVLQDIGEQLLFQEIINIANNKPDNNILQKDSDNIDNNNIIDNNKNNDNNEDDLNLDENLNIGSLIESKNKENKDSNNNKNNRSSGRSNRGERNSFSYESDTTNQILNKDGSLLENLSSSNIFNSSAKKNKSKNHISKFTLFSNNSTTNIKNKKKIKKPVNIKNSSIVNKNSSFIMNSNKKSSLLNYSNFNLAKNKNKNNSISLATNSNSNKISSSLTSSASSKNIHSYLNTTTITRNREKEVKEKKKIIEKEFQSIKAQKEREGIELRKQKTLKQKEIIIKKIREDKLIQKEKEKKKKEEEIIKAKSQYEKIKKEKEEINRELKIEKEKEKMNRIISRQNEKEKLNKKMEEMNKEREREKENMKMKKEKEKEREKEREKEKEKLKEEKEKEIEKDKEKFREEKLMKEKEDEEKLKLLLLKNKAEKEKKDKKKEKEKEKMFSPKLSKKIAFDDIKNKNFNLENNSVIIKPKNNHRASIRIKKENINDNKENNKNIGLNEKEIEKEKEIINKNLKKEEIKNKYFKNPNVYRCLKCNLIPKIFINEYDQEIEVFCGHSTLGDFHHNKTTYKTFQIKSSNHPINENISCYYCKKVLNQLPSEQMLYYCFLCKLYYCSDDELTHLEHKHQNEEELKSKYKSIYEREKEIMNYEMIRRRSSIGRNFGKMNKHNTNSILAPRPQIKKSFSRGKLDPVKKDKKEPMNQNEIQKDKTIDTKHYNKLPIYLMDTFCPIHDDIFSSYCHNCHKNICLNCLKENGHENHHIDHFEEIFLKEDELNKKKLELSIVKDNLLKINDYFMALIEAIKCKFERIYKSKQKEIEIKEKIIEDYEAVKYNYNCIMNIRNLNINNKQSFIDSTNNVDWLNRLNLIFEYLNSSLIIKSNDNIFKNLNNSKSNNLHAINFKNEKIKNVIKLYNNDFGVSAMNGELKIYDSERFKEKLKIKLFNEGEGINYMLPLKNGEVACCGYQKIKIVQLNLYNESYTINEILEEKYNNFLSLIEFNNNVYVSSGTSQKIQVWTKSGNNIKKKFISLKMDENDEINMLYKLIPYSFVGCSYKNKKLIKFTIKANDQIKYDSKLDNISFVKGSNSILNLSSNKNILLILYKDNIKDYGVMIISIDKFEIISKFQNINQFCFISSYEKDNIITIDKKGFIQKWKYSEGEKRLYEYDKIKYNFNKSCDDILCKKKLKSIISINKMSIFQYKNDILCISS